MISRHQREPDAKRRPRTPLARGARLGARKPSTLWLEAKALVLVRAAGRCEVCAAGGKLDVHHVVARSKFGRKSAARCHCPRTNLVALCRDCHEAVSAPYNATEGRLVITSMSLNGAPGYDWERLRSNPIGAETGRVAYQRGDYDTLAAGFIRSEIA